MEDQTRFGALRRALVFAAGIAVLCMAVQSDAFGGEVFADSLADWSTEGVQGQGRWSYGFYDLRDDVENGDGLYQPDDFISFLNDGSQTISQDPSFGGWTSSGNEWNGSKWDLLDNQVVSHGPWTELTATGGHPAGNGQGDDSVHWAVRRWESDVEGRVTVIGHFVNAAPVGDGVVGRVFVDGREILARKSDGNTASFVLSPFVVYGSTVDFVIDPDGSGIYNPFAGSGLDEVDRISGDNDWTDFFVQISNFLVPGDANVDLRFDQMDLVTVQIADKYLTGQPATWGEGDWNGGPGGDPGNPPPGDGVFDQHDIVAALAFGAYLNGPHAAMAPGLMDGRDQTSIVYGLATGGLSMSALSGGGSLGDVDLIEIPEPRAMTLLLVGFVALLAIGRRHGIFPTSRRDRLRRGAWGE